ncbi:HK97 gp10 family phage protein [Metabacillus litoralis]|uniref:HK97 gp10 family phage protein n=1 Tax=Metabacillus litoralis TaxID=152268 RepID=UPI00203BD585|nr:HK97 gp10 family phage protein [Metabacillus litoralis]MCM3411465.1 HK97 gp10 family phage protein [Metabacillus litoralis]
MIEIKGLTEFQKGLLELAQEKLPKESKQIMRKMGSKARTHVARKSRREIKKVSGNYQKSWKRGKLFIGRDGEIAIRVYNSARHAHLIEDGHRVVVKGKEVGFSSGKHILEKGMNEFEEDQMEEMLSDWLDDLLESGKL